MPDGSVIKVVVTHRAAAEAKYTSAGWAKIRHAVTILIAADKARGITTRFYALDSAADAKRVHAQPVASAADAVGIKAAIEAIFASWSPAYLALLGGPDLVTTVSLTNPLWTGNPSDDPDQFIPSDLPYACSGPLTFSPGDYRGPTRVIGRIPDLIGDTDPSVLVNQLTTASKAGSLLRASPQPVFAVSAKVWERSTALTVDGLPDVGGTVHCSPTQGPAWTATQIAPSVHVVNCHGGEFDPNWYGQADPDNWTLPTAIAARTLPGLVKPGTVVAAECCYGAAHWPPSAAGGQASVAMTYLAQGAAGVFGSSTVAYGPASSNAYADVICRLFVAQILAGASIGRAALVARQQFIAAQSFLDPTDLKTLAQFSAWGDPGAVPLVLPSTATSKAGGPAVPSPKSSQEVLLRRGQLATIGAGLKSSTYSCGDRPAARPALSVAALRRLLGRPVPPAAVIRTYAATAPSADATVPEAPRARARLTPRAHVTYLARRGSRPPSLVVVRDAGPDPDVRIVERR